MPPEETAVIDSPAPESAAPVAPSSVLPEGFSINQDYKSGVDEYFGKSEREAAAAAEPPVEKPKVDPVVDKKPTSLADQLVARNAPKPETAPVAEDKPPVDPIAEIEAEMSKGNAKWKPADGWAKLKTIAKTESQKRVELEAKLAEAETKYKTAPIIEGMTAEAVQQLKAEHKAASDRLMLVDLQSHPTFRAQYVEPKNAEVARAQELLEAHGVKGDVAGLLGKSRAELGKAVEEMTKDLPSFDRTEVADAVRKAYSLEQAGKAALGSSKELLKGIQANTQARAKAAFEERWAPVSKEIGEHLVKLEAPANATPEERAEVEQYLEGGRKLRENAEKYAFAITDEKQAAEVAMKAAAYDFHVRTVQPRIIKEVASIMADNARLAKELTALRSRNPNLRNNPPSDGGHTTKRLEDMSHEEAAAAIAARK